MKSIKKTIKTAYLMQARIDFCMGKPKQTKNKTYLNEYAKRYETSEKRSYF